jgi:hypothetical protein
MDNGSCCSPAELQLPASLVSILSSSDESCLFCLYVKESRLCLRAYHWSNFGSCSGIELAVPYDFGHMFAVVPIVQSKNIHLLGFDSTARCLQSIALRITHQETEFTLREQGSRSSQHVQIPKTLHNCIIDCYFDVWTKYPVSAAIHRYAAGAVSNDSCSLTFVTPVDHHLYPRYWGNLITKFERNVRKPTHGKLAAIHVAALTMGDFVEEDRHHTSFKAGEWFADVISLIPLHIAVARENRFVPLKDGVWSAEHERALLGAKVEEIVDRISFGWYESLFRSYLASMVNFCFVFFESLD